MFGSHGIFGNNNMLGDHSLFGHHGLISQDLFRDPFFQDPFFHADPFQAGFLHDSARPSLAPYSANRLPQSRGRQVSLTLSLTETLVHHNTNVGLPCTALITLPAVAASLLGMVWFVQPKCKHRFPSSHQEACLLGPAASELRRCKTMSLLIPPLIHHALRSLKRVSVMCISLVHCGYS